MGDPFQSLSTPSFNPTNLFANLGGNSASDFTNFQAEDPFASIVSSQTTF